ncbi:helix-turn-helix domain-containing protein [Alkalicoccobacillus gibsonii]|uniref:helix-turn-helix domain-containing protein n=1 Tax=Alkalicoccobacillus gibsonii TaxID=79881 RepID=UPI001931BCBF|nr:helix-turn-helix domain-containing protein [Alkalicoccobacillus gibsonii]MBM0066745.1 helix-turn-helix domain-containing protein [Alkalicoccobacillus gibsonii]
MTLGQRLRIARIQSNLKQKEAAKKLNISNNVLSTYERDFRDPDTQTLKKLAELYNVSADFLLDINSENTKEIDLSNPLDKTFNEVLLELSTEDIQFLSKGEIDEETAQLVKVALKNGVNFVDEYLSAKNNKKK